METYRRAESILAGKGVPITKESLEAEVTKLNYTKKSLDALAGGDDTFFVILDDRDDVWPTEVKLFDSGVPQIVPSDNLIKIPPYFFFDDQQWRQHSNYWLAKSIREVHLERELDITLIVFLRHLRKIHSKFFTGAENRPEELLDTKFFVNKLKNEVFACPEMISFEQIISSKVDMSQTMEGQMCDRYNLIMTKDVKAEVERGSEMSAIILTHDRLAENVETQIQ